MWKKILIWVGIVILALFGFLFWYDYTYSMEVAQPFEVNEPSATPKILIVYQGSDFKHQVVDAVLEHFDDAYTKGIDVSQLPDQAPEAWDVIFITHTWEAWAPPSEVEAFFKQYPEIDHVVTLTTSGDGNYKMDGVDAITSESIIENAPEKAKKVIQMMESKI